MQFTDVSVRGVARTTRCAVVDDRTVIVTRRWPRVAEIKDEDWIEGEVLPSADRFVETLRHDKKLRADIFTFSQKVTDPVPRFHFYYSWGSIAVIRVVSFSDWWSKRISNHIRQDVNRAVKRGVVVRAVPFTDDLVQGIVDIYNETPVRQGRPFWHYGKNFSSTKQMNATYLERSEFLGAFLGDELIGFLKVVYVDRVARLMQIIAKDAHREKRPMNALVAKAVEVCEQRKCSHLIYGNYQYFQGPDSLTAFKRRNGFEEVLVPRYYVPLSTTGRLALFLHLERGVRAWVPTRVQDSLRRVRASVYRHLPAT